MGNTINKIYHISTENTYYVHNVDDVPYPINHRRCCKCLMPSQVCVEEPYQLTALCHKCLITYKKEKHTGVEFIICNLPVLHCNLCTRGKFDLQYDWICAITRRLEVDALSDRMKS